jgi:hypothetical protein
MTTEQNLRISIVKADAQRTIVQASEVGKS